LFSSDIRSSPSSLPGGCSFWLSYIGVEGVDRLVADAKVETDPTRRFQQLAQAEKILIEDEAVIAPTFHQGFIRLIRPSVEGLVLPPYGVFVDFKYASIREE
jgi:oligopeptide transport system substrate-binding protein